MHDPVNWDLGVRKASEEVFDGGHDCESRERARPVFFVQVLEFIGLGTDSQGVQSEIFPGVGEGTGLGAKTDSG